MEILESQSGHVQQNHETGKRCDILLVWEGFVRDNPAVEAVLFYQLEQRAVRDACPTHIPDSINIVVRREVLPEMNVDAFVKEDFHAASALMARSAMA